MKNLFFGVLVLSAATFAACSDSKPSGDAKPATDTAATATPPVMQPATTTQPGATNTDTSAPAAAPAGGTSATPQVSTPQVQVQPMNGANPSPVQMNPQKVETPPGMSGKANPPHGQPGHSCAIPVGQKFP